jgi:O-antigen/teichoic acid export membrane protein
LFGELKKLSSDSAVYTIGNVLTKGLALLLLPVYTRALSPAEYGVLGITAMISLLVMPILSWTLQPAVIRFYVEYEGRERERKELLGTLLVYQAVVSALLTLAATAMGKHLPVSLFRQVPFEPYIVLALWIPYLQGLRTTVPHGVLLARRQAPLYISLNLAQFLLNVGLTIAAVVWLRLGALGALQAALVANLITGVASYLCIIGDLRLAFSCTHLRAALALSLPLLPHGIGLQLLSVSDRALLERWVDLSQVGLYSLGFQIGWAVQMINLALNSAWLSFFFRASEDDRRGELIPRFATYYVLVMATVCLATALFGTDLIRLVASPHYQGAARVVAWISLAGFMLGPYQIWADAIFYSKRTRLLPLATLAAAMVNVGLNIWLIPRYGIMATAVNNVVGYGVLATLVFLLSLRVSAVEHQYDRWIKVGVVMGVLILLGRFIVSAPWWLSMTAKLLLLTLLPLVLFAWGFFDRKEREGISRMLRQFQARTAQRTALHH